MFETLSVLVHAEAKTGKSTLGGSVPKPALILDAEGSTKFLPVRRIPWDPTRYAPPAADGTWDVCVVTVRSMDDIHKAYEWLLSGQHQFFSVVVDSISEIQRKLKLSLVGLDKDMEFKMWDQMLRQMDYILRGIRDLQDHPTRPVPVTVFVSESKMDQGGKWRPNMQGQMGTMLPYLFDLVGFLRFVPKPGPDGQIQIDPITGGMMMMRRLHIMQSQQWEAGERVQGVLGQFIDLPDLAPGVPSTLISDVYFHLFPNMRPQAA